MDTNSDKQWVEERLASLDQNSDWEPDALRGLARFRAQSDESRSRKRRWGWLVAGAVAASLPLMAFPTTRVFAQRCVSACVSQTNWVRNLFAGSPAPSVGYVKPDARRMAPDFILDDASGKPVARFRVWGREAADPKQAAYEIADSLANYARDH